jgi:hypothetical protein
VPGDDARHKQRRSQSGALTERVRRVPVWIVCPCPSHDWRSCGESRTSRPTSSRIRRETPRNRRSVPHASVPVLRPGHAHGPGMLMDRFLIPTATCEHTNGSPVRVDDRHQYEEPVEPALARRSAFLRTTARLPLYGLAGTRQHRQGARTSPTRFRPGRPTFHRLSSSC